MEQIKDDYIKLIHSLGGVDDFVSNKALASELDVSSASVSEMFLRLEEADYIEYVKYKGVRLKEKGIKRAVFLIRSHRLWETFLYNELGYSWDEIHDDAELLEHASSQRLINRLDQYLGRPKYCPHGTPIPQIDGQIQTDELIPLSNAEINKEYCLMEVIQDSETLKLLEEEGLTIRQKLSVVNQNSLRNTLTIFFNKRELEIGSHIADQLYIKEL